MLTPCGSVQVLAASAVPGDRAASPNTDNPSTVIASAHDEMSARARETDVRPTMNDSFC
jgi:hypothetical protein